MEINLIRQQSVEALKKELQSCTKELINMRFQQKTQQFKNTARFKVIKKMRARILTVLIEKKKGVQR